MALAGTRQGWKYERMFATLSPIGLCPPGEEFPCAHSE